MRIKNIFILIFATVFILVTHNACSQNKSVRSSYIFGTWKCVKHDYSGYQKFDIQTAERIRLSKLHIERNKFYYENSGVESCDFYKFNISKYDTNEYGGSSIEFKYTKKELSSLLYFKPVDKDGNPTCFNECAILYLKQDTLISFCGGYTYYLIKEKQKNANA
jgi:hypothetical protein